jgi:hypothetical protein
MHVLYNVEFKKKLHNFLREHTKDPNAMLLDFLLTNFLSHCICFTDDNEIESN